MPFALRALTPDDAPAAAALHALGFADPWSEDAFAAEFAGAGAVTLGHFEDGALVAFALLQEVAGEADLLTITAHPGRRRQGLARALLAALMPALAARGVRRITLDVAEDNAAARHLYASLGFTEDGRRPRYYTAGRDAPADAVLMSRPLGV